jgi:hypothetical protein
MEELKGEEVASREGLWIAQRANLVHRDLLDW